MSLLMSLMQPNLSAEPGRGAESREETCIANISVAERRKRMVGGIIGLALALAVLVGLVAIGADRWWRLALLPLFWAATVGYWQARDKT